MANDRKAALGYPTLSSSTRIFSTRLNRFTDEFDFIIVHGVFSWVPHEVRDALLELCADAFAVAACFT